MAAEGRGVKLLLHHIPKSGGTAVRDSLAQSLTPLRYNARAYNTAPHVDPQDAPGQIISSHFAFNPSLFRKRDPADIHFTWLRSPIDMFASAYYFWKYGPVNLTLPTKPEYAAILRGLHSQTTDHIKRYPRFEDYVLAALDGAFVAYPIGWFTEISDYDGWDFVGRLWHMREDLAALCDLAGISRVPPLHSNSGENYPNRDRKPVVAKYRAELETLFRDEYLAIERMESRIIIKRVNARLEE